ncbi:bacillithiol biosynthesis cysteine-adding enzyme BshC [Virgibacillus sp. MSP4-1]|uniref:bacillithiol biosynthesis cysteine-adding enzyme BshC n=1 Tax=Virgibacillus sp. MSP4-1 TaxID=2700081 RepID=UPI0003A35753|nr:bacillithiol biosynthesis cysteine-adding enzyme BshC [Virgibacillus sp. MSP4-1]QHS22157.1 bacillithiol biosynthesis cysteine-adding enzyme BshC [Virgibacillus sp. MSP4-1]
MRVKPISLENQSKLVTDYRNRKQNILQYFHYDPFDKKVFAQRLKDIAAMKYKREELSDVLKKCNHKWGAGEKTLSNIERLKDEKSVTVVGGQQAGLLTGPLYSIHKMISIIKLAREQEEALGVPVIPLFWIAGEDHDYEEINHVYLPRGDRMKKFRTLQQQVEKKSVSHMKLDQEVTGQWLDNLFGNLKETQYTKELHKKLKELIKHSETFVDFFAQVTFALFRDEGLVLLDSGDPEIRGLESEYFQSMMTHQPEIASGVAEALHQTSQSGYTIPVDADNTDGHLFYHHNGERVLLTVNEGDWTGKNGECSLTDDEIREIAEHSPELLSNNVVTRPMMQELLLPVLAFVGGGGEVAYWSLLKAGFEALGLKVPPVLPRLSFTLIDPKREKTLRSLALSVDHVIQNGVDVERIAWLKRQTHAPVEEVSDQVKLTIEKVHEPLRDIAKEAGDDVAQLADKNLTHLLREVEYLEQRIDYSIRMKHQETVQKFNDLELFLYPEGGLQERTWNVLYWLNTYGEDWIHELMDKEMEWESSHYVLYL